MSSDELTNSEAGTPFYAPVIRSPVLTYTSVHVHVNRQRSSNWKCPSNVYVG